MENLTITNEDCKTKDFTNFEKISNGVKINGLTKINAINIDEKNLPVEENGENFVSGICKNMPGFKNKSKTTSKKEMKKLDSIEKMFHFFKCWYREKIVYFYILYFFIYNGYFGYAIYRTWNQTDSYCSGVKLLSIINAIVYAALTYRLLFRPFFSVHSKKMCNCYNKITIVQRKIIRIIIWLMVIAAIGGFVLHNSWRKKQRFYSIGGYLAFILLGFIFSEHRTAIKWSQVVWGLTMQMVFGIIVFQIEAGKIALACFAQKIDAFLAFTNSGSELVFGYLATGILKAPQGNFNINVNGNETIGRIDMMMPVQNFIFAFSSMPVVIFFSFFVSILYYYGIMQAIVKNLGWFLQVTIGTTACESISASGNIFLGMTESPLLVKPFLPMMTKSELHTVLTGGFATIAGSVMAAYISFGISPASLLSASIMAAPAAISISKLFYPEIEESKTSVKDIHLAKGTEQNAIEAASNGAISAIKLVGNIIANLIAFVAFIAFINSIIGWIGDMIDITNLSFQLILSRLFFPIALMLGIEWKDAQNVASLIGLKIVVNEFVAYQELSQLIKNEIISKRSETIATFALCSFANISSIGIQVGGLTAMAPEKRSDLAKLAPRAMITGTIVTLMNASVAGMLS